jgi:acetyl-CoA carboxylase carboxyltransferase component
MSVAMVRDLYDYHHWANRAPDLVGRETPADGVVTGFGKVDGRLASVIA